MDQDWESDWFTLINWPWGFSKHNAPHPNAGCPQVTYTSKGEFWSSERVSELLELWKGWGGAAYPQWVIPFKVPGSRKGDRGADCILYSRVLCRNPSSCVTGVYTLLWADASHHLAFQIPFGLRQHSLQPQHVLSLPCLEKPTCIP